MKIDRRLNLVVPIERDDGSTLYIHTAPIGEEAFRRYFLVISKTFAAIYREGLSVIAGPRIAAMMLQSVAEGMGDDVWADVEQGLIGEVRRLSSAIVLTDAGWKPVMLDNALAQKQVTAEEWSEAEGAIVFFTVASSMHKRDQLPGMLKGLSDLWGTQVSSLNSTEFAQSLKILTEDETTGEKPKPARKASSIPS